MNFKEPVSVFAYNLIALHHDIMWYMIIIIVLVYWSLYKIIRDNGWSVFNKQEVGLLYFYNFWVVWLFLLVSYLIFPIYIRMAKNFFKVYFVFKEILDEELFLYQAMPDKYVFTFRTKLRRRIRVADRQIDILWKRFYVFCIGSIYYKHEIYEDFARPKFKEFAYFFRSRYLDYLLFNKTTNAIYYYEGFDKPLKTLKFKHSMKMEYVFGFFPTLIVGIIIVPSMYLLYSNETDIDPGLTIKIIGHQWYWSYEGTHQISIKEMDKNFVINYDFDSVIINESDLVLGGRRLLETDKVLVLPYKVFIRFLITSADVLHSWALPELGIKVDAVPGRLNQIITAPHTLGVYYGQCSELCGVSHGFMPIKINIISLQEYKDWILSI